jgi:hypothetical protein
MAGRTSYQAMNPSQSRSLAPANGWNRNGDRDRWDARRRSFANWYAGYYSPWLGYPYVIDPGFYDWSEPDDSAYDQGNAAPYTDYRYGAPDESPQDGYDGQLPPWNPQDTQIAMAGPAAPAPPAPEPPLTVILKGGRSPLTMQNYMMTGKTLTDLDAGHFAQIPVDQIDVAETQRVNSAAGVEFRVPGA